MVSTSVDGDGDFCRFPSTTDSCPDPCTTGGLGRKTSLNPCRDPVDVHDTDRATPERLDLP